MFTIIKEWIPRVIKKVTDGETAAAARNAKPARALALKGKFGQALALTGMSLSLAAGDNADVAAAQTVARVVQGRLNELKKQYTGWNPVAPGPAALALLVVEKLFLGAPAGAWATAEIKKRLEADPKARAVFAAAKKDLTAETDRILAEVTVVLTPP